MKFLHFLELALYCSPVNIAMAQVLPAYAEEIWSLCKQLLGLCIKMLGQLPHAA